MKRIAVIGAGLLGQQMAHYIKDDQDYEPIGFFDDFISTLPVMECGPILGTVQDVDRLFSRGLFDQLLVGIGYKYFDYRWQCFQRFQPHIPFLTFIHSSCFVDRSARIGTGSFLMPGSTVDNDVVIGKNVFVQVACSISHHSCLGDNCFLGPGVTVAGCVKVERDCFLGAGTISIDSVIIGPNIQTGGGTLIADSIQEPGLYVGVPARRIK